MSTRVFLFLVVCAVVVLTIWLATLSGRWVQILDPRIVFIDGDPVLP